MSRGERFETHRVRDLRVVHRPDVPAAVVAQAIALHRLAFARGRDACLHWGPGSSVSRVVIRGAAGSLDMAVKWNHWRGWRGALSDALHGSRGQRALAASRRVAAAGLLQPEVLAFAERRRLGCVRESFLLTRFLAGADPLPVALARLRGAVRERRALARALGDTLGALHAAGLDHRDLKHSNLLVDRAGRIALLDLEALRRPAPLRWGRRVAALGLLDAFARDLYPWLPDRDRLRFLSAYLRAQPRLAGSERRLIGDVRASAQARISRWERRRRDPERHFPLAPRDADPCSYADAEDAPGEVVRGPGARA
jgi:tRNA A-37 threonylcarbamoyl transferase component Bud32